MTNQSDKPVFLQIADQVRQDIAAGLFRAGESVPSIRARATLLRINPNTIKRAYDALQAEGILENRAGVGLFVTESGAAKASVQTVRELSATFESGVRIGIAARVSKAEIDGAYARAWDSLNSGRLSGDQEVKP